MYTQAMIQQQGIGGSKDANRFERIVQSRVVAPRVAAERVEPPAELLASGLIVRADPDSDRLRPRDHI